MSLRVRLSRSISRLRRRWMRGRIAASRRLCWWILGRREMLCAWAAWHRWPVRHALNALFLDPRHCDTAADWEAFIRRDGGVPVHRGVEEMRRAGLL